MALYLSLSTRNPTLTLLSFFSLYAKIRPFEYPTHTFKFLRRYSSLPLQLQCHLHEENSFNPESYYTSLLEKSTHKKHLTQIHTQLLVSKLLCNGFIVTKFINVSSNLGEIEFARHLFDNFPDPYVHLWNAIIRCYSGHNMFRDAIEMYIRMQEVGVSPDCFTIPHVLKACGGILAAKTGRVVHGQIFRHGFESDVFVQNGLVALYAKCGQINLARVVFDALGDRTVVSWTSIISGYAQNGQPLKALRIFSRMRELGVEPDWIALIGDTPDDSMTNTKVFAAILYEESYRDGISRSARQSRSLRDQQGGKRLAFFSNIRWGTMKTRRKPVVTEVRHSHLPYGLISTPLGATLKQLKFCGKMSIVIQPHS
ncbi:hypothetical protein RJ639_009380 [Escallonia herrerae]|uniref:Pentatricopeptide repeat-containing protein n=1 Tax=Escallonia herrerae TaxID=1293975 RepID=A0AA89ASV3_9ASTE|nr:hypothetical protein RJ639_009380 [Escallonia herrerae]